MASLSSTPLLSTTLLLQSKHSPSLASSPHNLPFRVSCNAEGRVDRRNMLLGLGSMYSAANLVSVPDANATPIQPPDFSKCGIARDVTTGKVLDVNCCPPVSDKIIDYKLPPVSQYRIRPAAHRVSKDYIAKYEEAVRRMKALDKSDPADPRGFMQQANIHCAYCNGAHDQRGHTDLDLQIHNSWLFFPFHRWYLYFYERILGSLIDDPTFALPFWNWDNPKGMQMPKMFDREASPLYNVNREPTHRPPTLIQLGTRDETLDNVQIVVNNLSVMYNEMIRSVDNTLGFMGAVYRDGDGPGQSTGMGSVERGSHIQAHVFVGNSKNTYFEDMGNFYSAGRDSLFYCHHANVDRMWSLWRVIETDVPKDIKDPDFLNASFLFYDENKQLVRVKVADAVDHKALGYDFERVDIPWFNYRPVKKLVKTKVSDISSNAKKAKDIFPLTLKEVTRVLVPRSASKGGVDEELLVLQDIEMDSTKYIRFDVYVNDEDTDDGKKELELDKAEYAGTFAQIAHKTKNNKDKSTINLKLTELYKDIGVTKDDDEILVTLLPRINGEYVTIGGIKVVAAPKEKGA